ncbi:MAG: hypothetical protein EWM72_03123 [Nitrospira sp.]|nr:MAG: hypothetical protein EWM72_03123 [Nitrospira sp.]
MDPGPITRSTLVTRMFTTLGASFSARSAKLCGDPEGVTTACATLPT